MASGVQRKIPGLLRECAPSGTLDVIDFTLMTSPDTTSPKSQVEALYTSTRYVKTKTDDDLLLTDWTGATGPGFLMMGGWKEQDSQGREVRCGVHQALPGGWAGKPGHCTLEVMGMSGSARRQTNYTIDTALWGRLRSSDASGVKQLMVEVCLDLVFKNPYLFNPYAAPAQPIMDQFGGEYFGLYLPLVSLVSDAKTNVEMWKYDTYGSWKLIPALHQRVLLTVPNNQMQGAERLRILLRVPYSS